MATSFVRAATEGGLYRMRQAVRPAGLRRPDGDRRYCRSLTEGPVTLRIAPGTQAGTVLRVKERGLARRDGTRGDLRARVRLVVPEHPTAEQKRLYEELSRLP